MVYIITCCSVLCSINYVSCVLQAESTLFDAVMADSLQLLPDVMRCVEDSYSSLNNWADMLGDKDALPFRYLITASDLSDQGKQLLCLHMHQFCYPCNNVVPHATAGSHAFDNQLWMNAGSLSSIITIRGEAPKKIV